MQGIPMAAGGVARPTVLARKKRIGNERIMSIIHIRPWKRRSLL
jgi:hypothetical protein